MQLTIAPGIQLIGWLYMIPNYALQSGSITQGLEETFSGKKPCCFCKIASDMSNEESKQEKHQSKEEKVKKYQLLRKAIFSISSYSIFMTDSYQFSGTSSEGFVETAPPQILS